MSCDAPSVGHPRPSSPVDAGIQPGRGGDPSGRVVYKRIALQRKDVVIRTSLLEEDGKIFKKYIFGENFFICGKKAWF